MACFLVSAAEAAVVTVVEKVVEKKEKTQEAAVSGTRSAETAEMTHVPLSRKLKWLRNMLWGGALLLLFEHIWHGEIVPWFPFLTAASDPADTLQMLREMMTVGVAMAALVTLVWLGMVAVVSILEKRAKKSPSANV